jgi:hypothetical protein
MYSLSSLIVELETARRRLLYIFEVPDAKPKSELRRSSTGLKIRSRALNNLRKDKRALALYCRPARYHWSPRKVGGIATPVARAACKARARGLNTEYMFWQQVQC